MMDPSSPPAPEQRLRDAIAAVPGGPALCTLGEVARAIPIPLGVETIGIRLRAKDSDKLFHLVAMDGASPREISRRALEPFSLALIRSLFVLGPQHSLSHALGHRWVGGRWIFNGKEALGVLTAGTRTDRKPTQEQEQLFTDVATQLGRAIRSVDRSTKTLERASALLARTANEPAVPPNPALDSLRPRERTILASLCRGTFSRRDRPHALHLAAHSPHPRQERLPAPRRSFARGSCPPRPYGRSGPHHLDL